MLKMYKLIQKILYENNIINEGEHINEISSKDETISNNNFQFEASKLTKEKASEVGELNEAL